MIDVMKQLLDLKEIVREGAKEKKDLLDLFWIFLRTLEMKATEEDWLDRKNIEDGYKLWNRIMKQELKPSWLK